MVWNANQKLFSQIRMVRPKDMKPVTIEARLMGRRAAIAVDIVGVRGDFFPL